MGATGKGAISRATNVPSRVTGGGFEFCKENKPSVEAVKKKKVLKTNKHFDGLICIGLRGVFINSHFPSIQPCLHTTTFNSPLKEHKHNLKYVRVLCKQKTPKKNVITSIYPYFNTIKLFWRSFQLNGNDGVVVCGAFHDATSTVVRISLLEEPVPLQFVDLLR